MSAEKLEDEVGEGESEASLSSWEKFPAGQNMRSREKRDVGHQDVEKHDAVYKRLHELPAKISDSS